MLLIMGASHTSELARPSCKRNGPGARGCCRVTEHHHSDRPGRDAYVYCSCRCQFIARRLEKVSRPSAAAEGNIFSPFPPPTALPRQHPSRWQHVRSVQPPITLPASKWCNWITYTSPHWLHNIPQPPASSLQRPRSKRLPLQQQANHTAPPQTTAREAGESTPLPADRDDRPPATTKTPILPPPGQSP